MRLVVKLFPIFFVKNVITVKIKLMSRPISIKNLYFQKRLMLEVTNSF